MAFSSISMPNLSEPSFQNGFAQSGDEALFPSYWDNFEAAWNFGMTGPSPSPYDLTGNSRDLVLNNMEIPTDYLMGQHGLYLRTDGSNEAGTYQFDVSSWTGYTCLLLYRRQAENWTFPCDLRYAGNDGIRIYRPNPGTRYDFDVDETTSDVQAGITRTGALTDWEAIGISHDSASTRVRGYLNDEMNENTGATWTYSTASGTFSLSSRNGGTSGYERGDYVYCYIWSRELTPNEVFRVYRDSRAPFRLANRSISRSTSAPTYPVTGDSPTASTAAITLTTNHAASGDSPTGSTANIAAAVSHQATGDSSSASSSAAALAVSHAASGGSTSGSSSQMVVGYSAPTYPVSGDSPTQSGASFTLAVSHTVSGDSPSTSSAAIAASYTPGGTYPISGDALTASDAAASLATNHVMSGDALSGSTAGANLAALHRLIGQAISSSTAAIDLAGGSPSFVPQVSLAVKSVPRSFTAETITRSLKVKSVPRSFAAK